MAILENIGIDINKGILKNIDIDEILYQLEFGMSNTPSYTAIFTMWKTTSLVKVVFF